MAFKLAISITLSDDKKFITLQDVTGDYDVSTNPTGWGTPNLDRADTWVKFYVNRLGTPVGTLNEIIASNEDTYDGLDSNSTITFPVEIAGEYRIDAIPFSSGLIVSNTVAGNVWHDLGVIYKTTVASTTDIVVEHYSQLFATPYPNIDGNTAEYRIYITSLNTCLARKALPFLCKCDKNEERDMKEYIRNFCRIKGIYSAHGFGMYFEAEEAIENLNKTLCC